MPPFNHAPRYLWRRASTADRAHRILVGLCGLGLGGLLLGLGDDGKGDGLGVDAGQLGAPGDGHPEGLDVGLPCSRRRDRRSQRYGAGL